MVFASSLSSRLSLVSASRVARRGRSHPVVLGAAGALVAVVMWLALAATAARADVTTFQYSSGYQYFIVPAGVTSVHFDVVGGAGGLGQGSYGGGSAGPGGAVIGDLPVTPGENLTLWAGGGGQPDGGAGYGSPNHNDFGGGAGGIATGGAFGAGNGGGGGAASYILINGTPVAVAGGGGGGGGSGSFVAGTDTSGGGASSGGYYASTKIPGSNSYGDTNDAGDAGTSAVLGGSPDYTNSDNGSPGGSGDPGTIGGGGGGGGGGYYVCKVVSIYICFAAGEGGHGGLDSWGGGGGAGGNSYADPSATNVSYDRGSFTPSAPGQITLSYGAPSATTLTASTATPYPGQSVTFRAFVDPTDGGGTVSFTNDGTAISGCSNLPFVSGGGTDWVVSCTTTSLTTGSHKITALYSGDHAYAGSAASTTENVYQSATSTSLTASSSSTEVGTAVTLTANVYSSDGGGTISFTGDENAFPRCRALPLVPVGGYYQATCTGGGWSVPGSDTITAEYSGDAPYGASSASTTITITAAAPTVTSISPKAGPTAGGGEGVQINGTHLNGASKVMFGTTQADVILTSEAVVLAEIPAHAAGAVDVTVTTPSGTSAITSADRYTYDAVPTVSSIAPASGGQGTVVTVNGTGFVSGTKAMFGTKAASKTSVVSATQLKATVPAGSGTVDVTVTNPGGTSATSSSDQFTYVVPSVSSVSPNAGPVAGGQTVTIHGTNLTGATGVSFGSAAATNVTVVSDTELTATTPAHVAGVADVTVTTAKGTSVVSSADRYTYEATPTISSITPASGGQGTVVTITGTGFAAGYKVKFGNTAATKSTMVSATQLTATVPAGSGTVDTTVTTPGGTSSTSASDQFGYVMPSVSAVSPNAGPVAGGQTVTIHGTNLTGTTGVTFGTAAATNVTVVSDTQLTATAPAHAAGMVDVVVTTAKGTSVVTGADRYTYDPVPTLSGLTPDQAPAGTVITITGTGFVGGAKVMFGNKPATGVKLVSATELQATVPANSVSYAVVTVTTPGGTSDSTITQQDLFYYS